ncbi:hypothetical protein P5_0027 [Aeromonas phage P5]|nr:hypothetical protein P5_0027 [Aeromonas phage P5]
MKDMKSFQDLGSWSFPSVNKEVAAKKFSIDDLVNVRKVLDDYHRRLMQSRDHIVYLYLRYFEAKSATAGSEEYRQWHINAAEKELAAAKADHLRLFKEELTLSFRKVV